MMKLATVVVCLISFGCAAGPRLRGPAVATSGPSEIEQVAAPIAGVLAAAVQARLESAVDARVETSIKGVEVNSQYPISVLISQLATLGVALAALASAIWLAAKALAFSAAQQAQQLALVDELDDHEPANHTPPE